MFLRLFVIMVFLLPFSAVLAKEPLRRGHCFMQDVYVGAAVKNVERETLTTLRIVAVEPEPTSETIVVSLEGTEFPKRVIGDVPIEADGSALFDIPLETPLLFQVLDKQGRAIQSMRKSATLSAEITTCVGCHAPNGCVLDKPLEVERRGQKVRKPVPLVDPRHTFSYPDLVQPIWDKHCVACHDGEVMPDGPEVPVMSLLPRAAVHRKAKGELSESYLNLVDRDDQPLVDWISPKTTPPVRKPYSFGSIQSELMIHLEPDHYEVDLSELEKKIIACWIDLGIPFGRFGPRRD